MTRHTRSARRWFLKLAAATSVSVPLVVRHAVSAPPSQRVRHASFGGGGMAASDLGNFIGLPNAQIVAVADVDTSREASLRKKYPNLKFKFYQDWRQLLDHEAKNLDAVNVGTPDHMHAPIAMSAMQLGLHTYIQKPLAHDLYEVRRLTEMAREKKLVTQMGIQIHSSDYYRLAVKTIQSGAIGKVKEVHAWSGKKWGDSSPVPTSEDPVPATLDWDKWIGVCSPRPYVKNYYHPGNWRKRLDFGTGTFGDMGCHIVDPPFEALALTSPLSVRSEGPAPSQWNWAINAVIQYVFPGTQYAADKTLPFFWYDGDARPGKDIVAPLGAYKLPDQGSLFVGTEGWMVLPHIAVPSLFPKAKFQDFKFPKVKGSSHWKQFLDAVQGEGQTLAPLDYSGPLTETVLLGGLSTHFPHTTLQWDAARLCFPNHPQASQLVRRTYRKGWEVKGLS